MPAMAGLTLFVAWRLIDLKEIPHVVTTSESETTILTQIDYPICATCAKRVFLECADLPGAENPATEVARA